MLRAAPSRAPHSAPGTASGELNVIRGPLRADHAVLQKQLGEPEEGGIDFRTEVDLGSGLQCLMVAADPSHRNVADR